MALHNRFRAEFGVQKNAIKKIISLEDDYTRVLNVNKDVSEQIFHGQNLNGVDVIHGDVIKRSSVEIKTTSQGPTIVEIDKKQYYTNKPINGSAIETTSLGSLGSNTYVRPDMRPTDDLIKDVINSKSKDFPKLPKSVVDHFANKFKSANKFGKYGRNGVENNPGQNIEMVLSLLSSKFIERGQDIDSQLGGFLEKLTTNDSDAIDLTDKSGFDELCDDILKDASNITAQFVNYDDVEDGFIDKNGFIKVDRQLFHDVVDITSFDKLQTNNNEQLVASCKHNDIDLNDWAQVKILVDVDNISDGRYLCNSCLAPIACLHLENLFNNRPIDSWSVVQKNNVYCSICEEFIGHIEQFSGAPGVILEYKYELSQATMSAIYRATSLLRGGSGLAEKLKTVHFKLIYDELNRFSSHLRQTLTWDIKQIVMIYGVMFTYIFITIYMGDDRFPVIFNDEPDVDLKQLNIEDFKKSVTRHLVRLSSQDNISINVGQISSYLIPNFGDAVFTVQDLLVKKMANNREMLAASRSISTKKQNATDNFKLEDLLKRRHGMSNATITKTINIDKIKNYSAKKDPNLRLKTPPKIDEHVFKKTIRDIKKSNISRTGSMHMILGCEGKASQEHIWDSDGNNSCKRCGEDYRKLGEIDDEHLKFLISNTELFNSMRAMFVSRCPEPWKKNIKHEGDPCINCGWPNIENKQYVDKYSYILYNMLDISDIKIPTPAHRQKKLTKYSLDTTEYQQQAGLTSIANRMTSKSHEHLLALIKQMFHLNATKLEMNSFEISKLFNLQEINMLLFKHRPSNTTLSSIVNVFMRSHEKGVEGVDTALELDDDAIQQVTDNDINIVDNIQLEDGPAIVDNEDEIDEIADRLSDIGEEDDDEAK